jgi:hypothetical protein
MFLTGMRGRGEREGGRRRGEKPGRKEEEVGERH